MPCGLNRLDTYQSKSMSQTKRPAQITRRWLSRWADKLAMKADVEQPYWFIHNAGGEESTFCFQCGEKRRLELIKKHRDDAHTLDLLKMLDGGWTGESDSCEHCHTCGQLLHYSLTDYGAESEWEHYREAGINLGSPEEAYHIQAMLQNGLKLTGLSKVHLRGKIPN